MSFFKYLGEFFLFRWFWRLFSGSHREGRSDLDGIDADFMGGHYGHSDPYHSGHHNSGHHNSSYDDGGYYGGHYDGEYDNRGQSFDDFMEEQDDWDMMEDGF